MRYEEETDLSRRPDFIFIKKSGPSKLNLLYASFVVEMQVGQFDNDHIGKLMKYNEEVLNSNPGRKFITSVLANLDDILLIRSKPGVKDDKHVIYHKISKNINFWEHGINFIKQFLDDPKSAGYDEKNNFSVEISREYFFFIFVTNICSIFLTQLFPFTRFSPGEDSVKYQLNKLVGVGLTGRVYSLITSDGLTECDDLVAKIFTEKYYFEEENEIMNKIGILQNSQNKHFVTEQVIKYIQQSENREKNLLVTEQDIVTFLKRQEFSSMTIEEIKFFLFNFRDRYFFV